MSVWLQWVIAAAGFAVVAPVIAWTAKRYGRRAKAGLALAGLLLGVGEVVDPPSKHMIEAGDAEEKESPTPGELPLAP